ncbi:MAG: phosphotransferase [Isosphaeraceae bacterium]
MIPSQTDEQASLIRRLQGLDLARGPLEIEPLAGGITNQNYVVRIEPEPGPAYVARLGEDRAILGVDRRNEVICHRAASDLGLAPELVHHEPGLLVTRFIPGRTLDEADIRDPAMLDRVAAILRRLHRSRHDVAGEWLYFCPFQTVRTYARRADRLGARLPDRLDALLEHSVDLARRIGPFHPSPCHNDLLPANLIDDGERLWLVDWEYAGVGHPLFDLANLAANAGLDEEGERHLISAYRRNATLEASDLAEFRVLRAASTLRESLWATIQTVASSIDFDYHAYAARYYQAYLQARVRLGASP